MKKFWLFLVVIIAAIGLIACSDDASNSEDRQILEILVIQQIRKVLRAVQTVHRMK